MACTTDTLVGEMCQVQCDYPAVDTFRDNDDCCPEIADNNTFNDFDCAPVCGNGIVEMGETCDTAITAGMVGACPDQAFCDDSVACTDDALVVPDDVVAGDGACRAYCAYTEHTAVADADGCCPAGATYLTDDDCVGNRGTGTTTCGNGALNGGQGETCDTAIAAGMPGACPTACSDADPCAPELLLSAGTCKATCQPIEKRFPTNDDMCCPVFWGANNRNDNDCTSSCGTPAEECSPGGVGACDTDCRLVRTAYRVTAITIQDPHIYLDANNGTCADLTGIVNSSTLPNAIKNDDDSDGYADLSWVHSFIPLDQAAATNRYELVYAKCEPNPDPAATTCFADPLTDRVATTANNKDTGSCLTVLPNTTTAAYNTPPTITNAPCFVTDALTLDLKLGSLVVPLANLEIAAEYVSDPATGLINGLLRGFVSEADAAATIIPSTIILVGGKQLSEILAGGITPGSCTVGGTPIGDDRDTGPDLSTRGWYFYVNFVAEPVPYDDRPNAM
jgi:hypothetical protein